jgi:hypothetical protein
MRTLLTILTALTLSGCWWEGPVFYQPDPAAAQPFAPGLYEVTDSDGKVSQTRMVRAADGSFGPGPEEKGDTSKLFFVRFPVPGRNLWISEMISTDPAEPGATYGLIEPAGDTIAHSFLIDCDKTATIVRAAGGEVRGGKQAVESKTDDAVGPPTNQSCIFKERASLERALGAYATEHPKLEGEVHLKRLGD